LAAGEKEVHELQAEGERSFRLRRDCRKRKHHRLVVFVLQVPAEEKDDSKVLGCMEPKLGPLEDRDTLKYQKVEEKCFTVSIGGGGVGGRCWCVGDRSGMLGNGLMGDMWTSKLPSGPMMDLKVG
jgi:hypothetical protein